MNKKIFSFLLTAVCCLMGTQAWADGHATKAEGDQARIGSTYYTTLTEAIAAANANDVVYLENEINVTPSSSKQVWSTSKDMTINLNNHNISVTGARAINVSGGTLTLDGTGTISSHPKGTATLEGDDYKDENGFYGSSSVIRLYGDNTNSVGLVIKSGVTISTNYCYGVSYFGNQTQNVDVFGKIIVTGYASALSGNGSYKSGTYACHSNVTLENGAEVSATNQVAIYKPEAGTLTINKATVTGPTAIGIKSGKLIIDGGTLVATGEDQSPTIGYSNGINTSGACIQIESNKDYIGNPNADNYSVYSATDGPVQITIKSGTFTSQQGITFYEYLDKKTSQSSVASIDIQDGLFKNGVEQTLDGLERKAVFLLSKELDAKMTTAGGFVTGGHFSHIFPVNYVGKNASGQQMGIISCPSTDTHSTDYKYTVGIVNADKGADAGKYIVDLYPGNDNEEEKKPVTVADWEGNLTAQPNAVGVITSSVSNNSFAKSTKNIIVNVNNAYVCPDLELADLSHWAGTADQTAFYAPIDAAKTFTVTTGSYTRQLQAGYNSVCVPFELPVDSLSKADNAKLYQVSSYSNGTVYLREVSSIEAGKPGLIHLGADYDWTFTFNSTPCKGQAGAGTSMTGTFGNLDVTSTATESYYGVDSNGQFFPVAYGILRPFRAVFAMGNAMAPTRMVVMTPGEATNLDELNAAGQNEKFMQNGKLMIRHNGQIFNAAGQLVK